MRLRKNRSFASEGDGRETGKRRRRWGPFSGTQLTVVIVAVAMVLIPTAAFAAIGTFTSTTATPAVTGTNSSASAGAVGVKGVNTGSGLNNRYGVVGTANGAAGIGVQGTGTKNGVVSNGPFLSTGNATIAAGKTFTCGACVTPADLSASAKAIQPLASGESESGMYSAAGGDSTSGLVTAAITFVRPLSAPISHFIDTGAGANVNCPGGGSAAPGYLCLYPSNYFNVSAFGPTTETLQGVNWFWSITGTGSVTDGTYTVTVP
jgi:hypothetical protein